jgi:hypothetical protein
MQMPGEKQSLAVWIPMRQSASMEAHGVKVAAIGIILGTRVGMSPDAAAKVAAPPIAHESMSKVQASRLIATLGLNPYPFVANRTLTFRYDEAWIFTFRACPIR